MSGAEEPLLTGAITCDEVPLGVKTLVDPQSEVPAESDNPAAGNNYLTAIFIYQLLL